MAWFGEGLSSLKGQLSNLAKNVLVDEVDTPSTDREAVSVVPPSVVNSSQAESGWSEAEEGCFIGQDENEKSSILPSVESSPTPQKKSLVHSEQDGNTLIPKGISKLLHQIGGAASQHLTLPSDQKNAETQTQSTLEQQNVELRGEVETLRRAVRDLESQIATSQDVNANLSTGLEELDIQHQEAIERIMLIKDDALKELEQLRGEMREKDAACSKLAEENESLLKQVEMLNLEVIGNETLSQENAELREKLSELLKGELPPIPEQSAAEEHVRTLEAEATALRESRDNLERETASLIGQLRQRDITLRQVDAKLEEVTKEKEIKEREMTQIVFECNSLREELKAMTENKGSLEKDAVEYRNEIALLKTKLEETVKECENSEKKLQITKREASIAKDESETLKAELESLKEDLGGGEARSLLDMKQLEEAKQRQRLASERIEALTRRVSDLEGALELSRGEAEAKDEATEKELDSLRGLAREYGIHKDLFREKESEFKRQLAEARREVERLTELNTALSSSLSQAQEKEEEFNRYIISCKELSSEKVLLNEEILQLKEKLSKAEDNVIRKEKDLSDAKSEYQIIVGEANSHLSTIKLLEAKMTNYEEQIEKMTNFVSQNSSVSEHLNELLQEKEKQALLINNLTLEISSLKNENDKIVHEYQTALSEKVRLEEALSRLIKDKTVLEKDKEQVEKANQTLLSEVGSLNNKCGQLEKELRERGVSREELEQARQQVEHLKDELQEFCDERDDLQDRFRSERAQLQQQVHTLRAELDTIPSLKQQLELTKHLLEEKNVEVAGTQKEIQRLSSALSAQLSQKESLHNEKRELIHKNEELLVQMQRKMASMEETETIKNKEIESLKQEIDNLKTQLEYASQLLQHVERQEGEGQPSGEQTSQKISTEVQEELSRLSAALLKEQTDKKILQNQLSEKEERLEKSETQLRRLKNHLVEVEESYSTELSTAEEKLREMQTQLVAAEERARNSTTAYTSASIRSNQQVEALKEQVRLLKEHKERMELERSQAEDAAAKQAAAVTRLQTVLHHFQLDKQKDIEFETERIRRDLSLSEKRNEELIKEKTKLEEQLEDVRRGLSNVQHLNEQLLGQSETITQLKSEIFELNEKLRTKEDKVNDLNSENKVDRELVTNLLVGYVASPPESRQKVLGVLGQVLGFSKEDRQKVGLEPGGRQQTLSEAFIKFLQSESQPRTEIILPLATTSPLPPSRKSSLLTPEVPVLPHFPVGRNPGSILKDVLQDRRPE